MEKNIDSDRYMVTSDSLQAYLRQINTIPLLSREEEVDLATRAQAGDHEALDEFIVSNLRYVVSVARRYLGYASRSPTSSMKGTSASFMRPNASTLPAA
jgi:DNA-directed RNA polymerase sigma subunit (sigma70/sigma32)